MGRKGRSVSGKVRFPVIKKNKTSLPCSAYTPHFVLQKEKEK
jgi:hypothetical protein